MGGCNHQYCHHWKPWNRSSLSCFTFTLNSLRTLITRFSLTDLSLQLISFPSCLLPCFCWFLHSCSSWIFCRGVSLYTKVYINVKETLTKQEGKYQHFLATNHFWDTPGICAIYTSRTEMLKWSGWEKHSKCCHWSVAGSFQICKFSNQSWGFFFLMPARLALTYSSCIVLIPSISLLKEL